MSATAPLKKPYPYFGSKLKVADLIWQLLGNPSNVVEPFFGSGAVLCARPAAHFDTPTNKIETVNELNPYIVNFWQAVKSDPGQVAYYADNPVFEVQLHARHLWLVNQFDGLKEAMITTADYYDAQIAGWWVWGISNWIGHGWCSLEHLTKDGQPWKRPLHLSGSQGITTVTRKVRHLAGDSKGIQSITRQAPRLSSDGQGINQVAKQVPYLKSGKEPANLITYFQQIAKRFERVRITCGDFERILGPSVTEITADNAVLLDPPYPTNDGLYSIDVSDEPAARAYKWAVENGNKPNLKIIFCCYEGEFPLPEGWSVYEWQGSRGYAGADNQNRKKERLFANPACIKLNQLKQTTLF